MIEGPLEDATAALKKGDYATAIQLLRPLADQGDADAQCALGLMYFKHHAHFEDKDVPRNGRDETQYRNDNANEGRNWLRLAADQGNAKAQYKLGVLNVRWNYPEGIRLLRLAADQGDADAQCVLGQVFANHVSMGSDAPKRGYVKDYSQAVKWYRLAANQGHSSAQLALGDMHRKGQGVPSDYAEALKFYCLAADHGNKHAQYNLGIMYSKGELVPQKYVSAYMWLSLAAAQGVYNAEERRDRVAKKMTPAQIAEAQKLARVWKPTKQQPR